MLLIAGGILMASAAPDGIQKLAAQAGIAAHAPIWLHAPLADYEWQGMHSPWLRKVSAGFTGMVLLYGACLLTGRFLTRQRST
jgi:hypothetical protein